MKPVALVTGAASGFGMLASVELAKRGFRVFASMRDLSRAQRLDALAAEAGVEIEKTELDVTKQASIDAAMAKIGQVDVLVNNAGFGLGGMLEDVTMEEMREQLETNFFGVVAMTKAVLPGMRERRRGRIINLSSLAGKFGQPGMSAYCASKHAVEGLSESLRVELAPLGIFVSLVEPGAFKTDIFSRNKRVAARARTAESPFRDVVARIESQVDRHVEKSGGDPMKVARAIAKLATQRRPPLRVAVGSDARAVIFAKAVLPYRLIEWGFVTLLRRQGLGSA